MKKTMAVYAAVLMASLATGCSSIPFTNIRLVNGAQNESASADKQEESPGGTNTDITPATSLDAAGRLQRLKDLKDKGLISEEEYQQKRKTIIDEL